MTAPNRRAWDSPFLKACRGEATPYTPIWLNRQAGRYMPEYHQVKGDTPSLQFFKSPELAARVTLDARRLLDVDAAILFADLLPILEPMGFQLDYLPGRGPVIGNPLREVARVDDVRLLPARDTMPYIGEAIRLILADLPSSVPLIGFAGAPFTLASYAVEGEGSRNHAQVKRFMYGDEGAWHSLMERISTAVIDYADYQISCGVQAFQLFDSWVGCLAPADYEALVLPHSTRVIQALRGRVPVIHFGTGNPALAPLMDKAGADVMALDWRAPLAATWDALSCKSVQGNLDPMVLCAEPGGVRRQAARILAEVDARPGHIFNLGHGIVPETPVDNVKLLVDFVHETSRR